MSRLFVVLSVLASFVVLGGRHPAVAANDRTVLAAHVAVLSDGEESEQPHVRAKDAGSVDGEVVSVDYRTNHFTVKSGTGTYDVVVLPSTDFRAKTNTFHGVTDIKKGAHVNVMLSQRAQTLTAQIIYLL